MKQKIFIIQPYLTKYRLDIFKDLDSKFNEIYYIAASDKYYNYGVNKKEKKLKKIFLLKRINLGFCYYLTGIEKLILRIKPKKIIISGDFRSINYWIILLFSKIKNIEVFVHGQGLFKKNKKSYLSIALFKISLLFCKKYICYNEFIKFDLKKRFNISSNKITYIDNTIINNFTVVPKFKKRKEIIFIGRLRENSNLGILFDALIELRQKYKINFKIKIIGDGKEKNKLIKFIKTNQLKVKFYGQIYEQKKINKISKKSLFGIYPGNAGLSVVHYMSLSLITIVHDSIYNHSGPEPSYIKHNYNGFKFKYNNKDDLIKILKKIYFLNDAKLKKLAKNSYRTYQKLNKIKMSTKFEKILN
jgi:glycosyltransferase involved in cell wall biosynthesis